MAALTTEQREARAAKRRMKAALEAEAEHHRRETRRREWQERRMYLTRAEMEAGEPCRVCGLPLIDGLGSWPVTNNRTPEQQADCEAADVAFRERHAGCHAIRWSISGSRATHCGACCPPHPMRPTQLAEISRILSNHRPDPSQMTTWLLELTCGHSVEGQQHRSRSSCSTRVVECRICWEHRGVVTSQLMSVVDDVPPVEPKAADQAAALAELSELRRQADALATQIAALERSLVAAPSSS